VVDTWQTVAALMDPVRRSLFEHVRRQRRPVTREEAAAATAISRNLTAFHLDKLVDAGLLRARYEAPSDQHRGPGRTPKVYEPTDAGVCLTVPPRQYELAATILADALAQPGPGTAESARQLAYDRGRTLAAGRAGVEGVLAELGFEPRHEGTAGLVLGNCPFHALAKRHPELICGINHALVQGIIDGLGAETVQARLEARSRDCCVQVIPAR